MFTTRSMTTRSSSARCGVPAANAWAVRTGNADVDAVERIHFVEYGVLAVCLYRVWRSRADPSSLALPLLAGVTVGVADEFVQWFVPGRVGEMHDIFLNAAAV